MPSLQKKDFASPDDTRKPDKAVVEVVKLGEVTAARMTIQPGWKWSECIKPVVGTESCQARHVGVLHTGRMKVVHDDGSEIEVGPGEAYIFEPGHDGWVEGDEAAILYEFNTEAIEHFAEYSE